MVKKEVKDVGFFEWVKVKLNKISEDHENYKKKRESFSIREILIYEKLKIQELGFSNKILFYPIYLTFWSALFLIMLSFIYDINIRLIMSSIIKFLIISWTPIIIILIFILFEDNINVKKVNRKLTDKIISERKK